MHSPFFALNFFPFLIWWMFQRRSWPWASDVPAFNLPQMPVTIAKRQDRNATSLISSVSVGDSTYTGTLWLCPRLEVLAFFAKSFVERSGATFDKDMDWEALWAVVSGLSVWEVDKQVKEFLEQAQAADGRGMTVRKRRWGPNNWNPSAIYITRHTCCGIFWHL